MYQALSVCQALSACGDAGVKGRRRASRLWKGPEVSAAENERFDWRLATRERGWLAQEAATTQSAGERASTQEDEDTWMSQR